MDLHGGKNQNPGTLYKDRRSTTTREEVLQALVEFFHLESAEAQVKGKHESVAAAVLPESLVTKLGEGYPGSADDSADRNGPRFSLYAQPEIMPTTTQGDNEEFHDIDWGYDICSECSKAASAKPSGYACSGWGSKCSALWCDACLEAIKTQVTLWGDGAQAHC
jgi:hypothetical protein